MSNGFLTPLMANLNMCPTNDVDIVTQPVTNYTWFRTAFNYIDGDASISIVSDMDEYTSQSLLKQFIVEMASLNNTTVNVIISNYDEQYGTFGTNQLNLLMNEVAYGNHSGLCVVVSDKKIRNRSSIITDRTNNDSLVFVQQSCDTFRGDEVSGVVRYRDNILLSITNDDHNYMRLGSTPIDG